MSKQGRSTLNLAFADADSVRAEDIPYDGSDSIKSKIDSIGGGGGGPSFVRITGKL